MKFYHVFLISTIAISAASSVLFVKKYTQTHNLFYIVMSFILCMITIYSYINLLKYENLSYVYPTVKILSIIIVTTSSIFFFNEKINTTYIIGLLLGILSICILSTSLHSHK